MQQRAEADATRAKRHADAVDRWLGLGFGLDRWLALPSVPVPHRCLGCGLAGEKGEAPLGYCVKLLLKVCDPKGIDFKALSNNFSDFLYIF